MTLLGSHQALVAIFVFFLVIVYVSVKAWISNKDMALKRTVSCFTRAALHLRHSRDESQEREACPSRSFLKGLGWSSLEWLMQKESSTAFLQKANHSSRKKKEIRVILLLRHLSASEQALVFEQGGETSWTFSIRKREVWKGGGTFHCHGPCADA